MNNILQRRGDLFLSGTARWCATERPSRLQKESLPLSLNLSRARFVHTKMASTWTAVGTGFCTLGIGVPHHTHTHLWQVSKKISVTGLQVPSPRPASNNFFRGVFLFSSQRRHDLFCCITACVMDTPVLQRGQQGQQSSLSVLWWSGAPHQPIVLLAANTATPGKQDGRFIFFLQGNTKVAKHLSNVEAIVMCARQSSPGFLDRQTQQAFLSLLVSIAGPREYPLLDTRGWVSPPFKCRMVCM